MKNIREEYFFLVHYVYYTMSEEYVLKSLFVNSELKKKQGECKTVLNSLQMQKIFYQCYWTV